MRWTLVITAIVVACLFLTSAIIQPWYRPDDIQLKVERTNGTEGSDILVNYSISSSLYSDPVKIVLVPVARYGFGNVSIFIDKDSVPLDEYARLLGLYDHLRAEMKSLGMDQPLNIIDRAKVLDILNGGPGVLIIANSTVDWSNLSTSMISWVNRGGLMVGLGDSALPFVTENSVDPLLDGKSMFQVRYEPTDYASGNGVSRSEFASALDMKYISPRFGMNVADVQKYGQPVGFLYQRTDILTSAALIQIGAGAVILFSDIMIQPFAASMEDVLAQDLARMMVSGLPWSVGAPYSLDLDGKTGTSGSFTANLASSEQVVCFAYSVASFQHRYRVLLS